MSLAKRLQEKPIATTQRVSEPKDNVTLEFVSRDPKEQMLTARIVDGSGKDQTVQVKLTDQQNSPFKKGNLMQHAKEGSWLAATGLRKVKGADHYTIRHMTMITPDPKRDNVVAAETGVYAKPVVFWKEGNANRIDVMVMRPDTRQEVKLADAEDPIATFLDQVRGLIAGKENGGVGIALQADDVRAFAEVVRANVQVDGKWRPQTDEELLASVTAKALRMKLEDIEGNPEARAEINADLKGAAAVEIYPIETYQVGQTTIREEMRAFLGEKSEKTNITKQLSLHLMRVHNLSHRLNEMINRGGLSEDRQKLFVDAFKKNASKAAIAAFDEKGFAGVEEADLEKFVADMDFDLPAESSNYGRRGATPSFNWARGTLLVENWEDERTSTERPLVKGFFPSVKTSTPAPGFIELMKPVNQEYYDWTKEFVEHTIEKNDPQVTREKEADNDRPAPDADASEIDMGAFDN